MDELIRIIETYLNNRAFRYDNEEEAREIAQDIIEYVKEELNNGVHEIDNGHSGTQEA